MVGLLLLMCSIAWWGMMKLPKTHEAELQLFSNVRVEMKSADETNARRAWEKESSQIRSNAGKFDQIWFDLTFLPLVIVKFRVDLITLNWIQSLLLARLGLGRIFCKVEKNFLVFFLFYRTFRTGYDELLKLSNLAKLYSKAILGKVIKKKNRKKVIVKSYSLKSYC